MPSRLPAASFTHRAVASRASLVAPLPLAPHPSPSPLTVRRAQDVITAMTTERDELIRQGVWKKFSVHSAQLDLAWDKGLALGVPLHTISVSHSALAVFLEMKTVADAKEEENQVASHRHKKEQREVQKAACSTRTTSTRVQ